MGLCRMGRQLRGALLGRVMLGLIEATGRSAPGLEQGVPGRASNAGLAPVKRRWQGNLPGQPGDGRAVGYRSSGHGKWACEPRPLAARACQAVALASAAPDSVPASTEAA